MDLRRPSLLTRFSRALLLLTFAVGSPALGGAYRCCTVAAEQSERESATSNGSAGDVGHAHHATPDSSEDAPAEPCECVGQCHQSPPLRPLVASISTSFIVRVGPLLVRTGGALLAPARAEDHRQPFGNGPPSSARS